MRRILIGVLSVVIVMGAAYFYMSNDNQKDKKVWDQFRSQLTAENIKEISLDDAVLETDEFSEVISLIRKLEFDKSNRVKHGPTPVAVITIVFVDGIKIHVGYWGGTTFELSPEHIDIESQFLVTNDELGDWINSTKR